MLNDAGVVEYVTFRAKEGVDSRELMKAAFDTDAVLDGVDGYIKRVVAKQATGVWVEVVFWRDLAAAEKGLKVFQDDPRSQPFLSLIEEGSVDIQYSDIVPAPGS